MPKMFMHGEQNQRLSYLPLLRRDGVHVEEVPVCGHFPMYFNPTHMWQAMAAFLRHHDAAA